MSDVEPTPAPTGSSTPPTVTRSGARPKPGQLTFTAPRGGRPPQHLADLDPAERKAAVVALGHKGFRAK